ncbi:hypothetical protein N836_35100 [Leptolyngbya sp. Heron Island J]|uniref:hypothetical protein n=1 Tax=Leptolyngbya sp. Heron Island J TaxID=1385935 RepID=UPI0003B9C619|nr:hypothetical protein [Leptolyngbya sp. Heron Island J]ESA37849.1 hypothetical protein N836_35100 [Leptolyngbya sp. Heron Island J]
MVSNDSGNVSSYELFQELLKIKTEYQQLKDRMSVLSELKRAVAVQLADKCACPNPEIDQMGVVRIDGQFYFYKLYLEDGTVDEFYAVSQVNQGS